MSKVEKYLNTLLSHYSISIKFNPLHVKIPTYAESSDISD